jgi:PAS domain S-box-containing protein
MAIAPDAPRVLILARDPEARDLVARMLASGLGSAASLFFAASLAEARRRVFDDGVDAVLLDEGFPEGANAAFVSDLRERGAEVPVILLASFPDRPEAHTAGAFESLAKSGLTAEALAESIGRAVASRYPGRGRHRIEEALRRSERRYRLLFERNLAGVVRNRLSGEIIEANETAARILGAASAARLIGRSIIEFYRDVADRGGMLERLRKEKSIRGIEIPFRREDGRPIWILGNIALWEEDQEEAIVEATLVDITARKKEENALQESEELYRILFDANPLPAFLYDAKTLDIVAVNDAAVGRYGYSRAEFLSMNARDLRPEEGVPGSLKAISEAEGALWRAGSWRHRRKDGSIIDVDVQSHEVTLRGRRMRLTLANDVTERRELEQQLRQAQKMEAVGTLAGGIAHDFNNLLTTILGYSELLLDRLEAGDAVRSDVEEIRKAGERAASLTRQLLAFSRKQVLQARAFDLNGGVANVEKMLGRLIGEDIELETRLDPALGMTVADPGQIDQVIMNLAINARDAMPEGGKLTIETANVELDEEFIRQHVGARPGSYVMLGMSDTGIGMNEETRERVFEPFFTTKEPGKGTGLGLAMVYGIVKQSEGYIWVESELGRGTSFKIYLPRTDRKDAAPVSGTRRPLLGGSETVLLVEDEEPVRRFAQRVLEGAGYRVVGAPHGEAAIEIMAERKFPVDLLLTDTVMPGMSGPNLAVRLLETFPTLKILYMSGYTDAAVSPQSQVDSARAFLQKPFTAETLLRKVREVIAAARSMERSG